MQHITGLVGRDDLVHQVVREIKKGKHVVLTGPVGIGKSAVLEAALKIIEPHPSEWYQFNPVAVDAGEQLDASAPAPVREDVEDVEDCMLAYLTDHQAKGQFVQMARRFIETWILKPSALNLAKKYDQALPEWTSVDEEAQTQESSPLATAEFFENSVVGNLPLYIKSANSL